MSKEVQEVDFKFYPKYIDALMDSNYHVEKVDVEGGSPPDRIESKMMKENYSLKTFTRKIDGVSFLETVYLKQN